MRFEAATANRCALVAWLTWCILGWWLLWLGVACLGYGGLSSKTVLLVLVSLTGFGLGSLWGGRQRVFMQTMTPDRRGSLWVPILVLSVIVLYQIPFALRTGARLATIDNTLRSDYYEGGGIPYVINEQILIPLALYLLAYWMCERRLGGLWTVFVILFFVLDATGKGGRFPLFFALFFLALGRGVGILKIQLRYFVGIGLAALVSVLAYSFWLLAGRGEYWGRLSEMSYLDIFEALVIKYHVGGFYMLQEMMDLPMLQTGSVLPYYTLGYFQYLASIVLRRFGIDYGEYPLQVLSFALTDVTEIPYFGSMNAFCTNVLPLYLDGGFVFAFLGFYLYGISLRCGSRGRAMPLSPIGVITGFVMVFGLFQPLATTGLFYVPLLLHFGRQVWCRRLALRQAERHRANIWEFQTRRVEIRSRGNQVP